ncbi:MAG: hypothetical protein K0Q79_3163 [Flavipsychrobacter sp.]|nr:hypothetical protein [Flavipsychrobacter sp.]
MSNNFDNVFAIIKQECEKQKSFAEISCFDRVALAAGIPLHKLPLYLSHLQDTGLIKYSMKEKYIYLTSLGHKRKVMETIEPAPL